MPPLGPDIGTGGVTGLERIGASWKEKWNPPASLFLFWLIPSRIEEELGDEARFAGHNFRNPSVL